MPVQTGCTRSVQDQTPKSSVRACVRACVQVPETRGPAFVRACPVCASAGAGSHHPMVCMAASLSRWQPPIPSSAVILWHAVTAKRSCGLTHSRPWNHLRCDRPRTHARAREHNRTQRMHAHSHAHNTHPPHTRARAYMHNYPPAYLHTARLDTKRTGIAAVNQREDRP
jgi:hypothetical protein